MDRIRNNGLRVSSNAHTSPKSKLSILQMEGGNEARILLAIVACLCYCHFISSRLPKGKWRLASLLPIFHIFTILPLYTNFKYLASVIGFLISWLSNFKLLLFAFGRGPIICRPDCTTSSLGIFVTTAALPFYIKTHKRNYSKKILPLSVANEIPIFALLASSLRYYKECIHVNIQMIGYCILLFLYIDILVELSSLLVCKVVRGLELGPASDEPYLSTSLRDFWGRRWDPAFGSILREAVHMPVRSAVEPTLGRDWAAVVGILVTFFVSGLMHELNTWYFTRTRPSWETTAFFVVHGVCVAAQRGLGVAFPKRKEGVPRIVSVPATLGFVVATSLWLFWPPLRG